MRIAQVTPVFPPRGGMGTVAKEYVDGLRANGDSVDVFTPSYEHGLFWGNAALMPKLLWKLRGYDVIHLHYPFYGGAFFSMVASILWRTPLVVTYHMRTKANGWLGVIFFLCRVFIEPLIIRFSKVILISSFDYAHSVGFDHRFKNQLVELPFGVDTKRFYPGEKADIFTFLFVGGMDDAHYFKGIDVLIDALAELPRDEQWRAVFVGDGGLRKQYEEHARLCGLADRIEFIGRVSEKDLPKLYRSSHAHVLPSIDRSEAFGLVTLEAAASGTASLVSRLPGVRTLVDRRQTGLLVRPRDVASLAFALRAVMMPGVAERMGKAARERALLEYDQEFVMQRLQDVYKRVKVSSYPSEV